MLDLFETARQLRLMRSRSTSVNPKACLMSQANALARSLSIQMHARHVERRSRSTPVDPNAQWARRNALSLDVCRSKRAFDVLEHLLRQV